MKGRHVSYLTQAKQFTRQTYGNDETLESNQAGTNSQTDGDHVVLAACLVQVLGQSPGRSVGVESLEIGTAPRRAAV